LLFIKEIIALLGQKLREVIMKSRFFAFILIVLMSVSFAFAQNRVKMEDYFDHGYFVTSSEDGAFKLWFDGRIMIDTGFFFGDDNNFANGTETRRARISFKTIMYDNWAGEWDIDVADNEVEIKDFWMAYIGFDHVIIKLGNHKMPFSMEEVTSSRNIVFMERALPNVFTSGRRIGLSVTKWADNWRFQAGFFGQEVGEGEEEGENEAWGYAARFTYEPVMEKGRIIHLGASYQYLLPDAGSDDRIKFKQRPELHLTEKILDTGKIKNVDDYSAYGVEFAGQFGALSWQAEYISQDVNRYDKPDASFDGYYVYVSYFITGETRQWKKSEAEFGAVTPNSKKGALEVALRYSHLDLNDEDADIWGGKEDNFTIGINYYFNENIRFMMNYIFVNNDEYADGDGDFIGNDDFQILAFRFQYLF